MPTLLEEPVLQTLEETHVEEFDLERLARLSAAPPAIEPPRFELLEPAPRFRFQRTLLVAFLAAVVVAGLATLRPDVQANYTPAARSTYSLRPDSNPYPPAASRAGSTTTGDTCPVAD